MIFYLELEKLMGDVWYDQKMEVCGELIILQYKDDIVVMREMREKFINTAYGLQIQGNMLNT